MGNKYKFIFFILLFAGVMVLLALFLGSHNIAVLDPKGMIALKERNLMIVAVQLMLLVVIPVIVLTFFFAWKYRAGNTEAKYAPDQEHRPASEFIWWALPSLIVLVLAMVTWKATHELDPYKAIDSNNKSITIQVVALQWKWLFIYPEYNIATVNFVQFPEDTPINFVLTADAPMNSFWIPQLGGQMYAMTGHVTQLHLMADAPGEYAGSSAEISGRGFSGMRFVAKAVPQSDFDIWAQFVRQSPDVLNLEEYNELAEPSENHPLIVYSLGEKDLFGTVVMKYMMPHQIQEAH